MMAGLLCIGAASLIVGTLTAGWAWLDGERRRSALECGALAAGGVWALAAVVVAFLLMTVGLATVLGEVTT